MKLYAIYGYALQSAMDFICTGINEQGHNRDKGRQRRNYLGSQGQVDTALARCIEHQSDGICSGCTGR